MFPGIPPSPCPEKRWDALQCRACRACREPCVVDLFGSGFLVLSGGIPVPSRTSRPWPPLWNLINPPGPMGPHDARYTPTMPSEPAITVSVEGMKFQQLGGKPSQRVWTYLIYS